MAVLVGRGFIKKIEKPERTIETLRDLPELAHREAPGARHRAVPEAAVDIASRKEIAKSPVGQGPKRNITAYVR